MQPDADGPPYDESATPRSAVILRVLRRTVIGDQELDTLLDRLTREVRPTTEDLVDALVAANSLSSADHVKGRIIDLLCLALDARTEPGPA